MKKSLLSALMLLSHLISAQEVKDTAFIPGTLTPPTEGAVQLPIPGSNAAQPADSIRKSDTAQVKDSTLAPLNRGFLIGARWSFTSSKLFDSWVDQQTYYLENVKKTYSDMRLRSTVQWLMKPERQSFAFPFTLGVYSRIDSLKSFTIAASYAYRKSRAAFSAVEDSSRITIFENSSQVQHHQAELTGAVQFKIPKEYFAVTGVDNCGTELSLGVIPIAYLLLETTGSAYEFERSGTSCAAGGSWGVGFFTEKQLSAGMLLRALFNYHGTALYGYPNTKSLYSNQPVSAEDASTLSTEHFFELGFQLALKKQPKKVQPKEVSSETR